jgi:hypothetical protein
MFYNIQEQEEWEYQLNAKADYLSEAFGDEGRRLAAQGADEMAEGMGFTSYAAYRSALAEEARRQRCANAIRANHAEACQLPSDDIPF